MPIFLLVVKDVGVTLGENSCQVHSKLDLENQTFGKNTQFQNLKDILIGSTAPINWSSTLLSHILVSSILVFSIDISLLSNYYQA